MAQAWPPLCASGPLVGKQRPVLLLLRILHVVGLEPRCFTADRLWLLQLQNLGVVLSFLHHGPKMEVIENADRLDGVADGYLSVLDENQVVAVSRFAYARKVA